MHNDDNGDLYAFPTLADCNGGRESSPGPLESIGGVSIFLLDEPWKYEIGFGRHCGVWGRVEGGGWISFVYCRGKTTSDGGECSYVET